MCKESVTLHPGRPILVCEGASDQSFLSHLAKARKLGSFDVIVASTNKTTGNTVFEEGLKAIALLPAFDKCPSVVVIGDNDDDPVEARKNVFAQVERTKWSRPASLRAFEPTSGLPPLAVLMLPWDDETGCIETMLYKSASAHRRKVANCVEKFIECTETSDRAVQHMSKYRLRCLVAASSPKDPSITFGNLWRADRGVPPDLVPLDHSCFGDLANFLASVPR